MSDLPDDLGSNQGAGLGGIPVGRGRERRTITKEPEGLTLTYEDMYLRFTERHGYFNLADRSDESTNWTVALYNDDHKVVERNGVPCKLEWSLDGDKQGWFEMGDGIENLVEESWSYANSIISTRDYHAQTLAFAQTYNENREALIDEWEVRRKKNIFDRIESLKRSLDTYELYDEPIDFSVILGRKIEMLKNKIVKQAHEVSQYKKGSDLYVKEVDRLDRYKSELEEYEEIIKSPK